MQSEQFDQDNNSNGEEDVMLNDVDRFLLQLDSTVYEIGIRDAQSNQTLLKTVANGTYDRKEVVMVQFSGTSSSRIKQKVFRNHLRYCVTSTHANIARFIGGTNPSSLDRFPFVLIRQSPGLDHEEFLRLNGSTKALMRFLEGVQQGTRFIYEHGIKQRDCIKVLPSGDAVVYPSGVLRSKFSGRNSTKRAVRHLLRDVDLSDPVLPLQAIYELLSAAEKESQSKAIGQALLDVNPVTEHTIWRIADVLELPITRELHYHGPLPKFTLAVGDAGHVEPPLSVDVLARANSKISIESWNKAISTTSNEDEGFRKTQVKWRESLSSRAMKIQAATPYFLDYDFPLSSVSIEGWLRYDDVLKKAEGKYVDMCLLYATEKRANSLDTPRVERVITHGDEPIFTVRSICTRLRFEIPASNSVPKPVYFHRRPNVDASPREYWGFISDMNDPLAPPSRQIQELTLQYEIQIRTIMRGDSWGGRADARLEDELKRLPGTFFS